LVVPLPFFRDNMTFAKYLKAKLTINKLSYAAVGKRTGLHPQSIRSFVEGEYKPRLANLIMVLEVIAEAEGRCPRELIFECLMHLDEVQYAVKRSKKWIKKEPNR